jgi:uncharacterized protein DUF6502
METQTSQKGPREHLLETFRRVLRPLVRILVRAGVRYDEFLELIRRVYVETAVRDGLGDGVPLTRSRVSISTGVARRDVDRFIDKEDDIPPVGKSMTRSLMEVLHEWHTNPHFVGPYGIPLELELGQAKSRGFQELVNFVNPSVASKDALEELVRLRAVVRSGGTHVRAVSRVLKPVEEMSPAQLEVFGNALTRLADTVQFNMDARNLEKRLEQSVISDHGLPKDVVPIFEKYVRERVMELLIEIDNWLSPYSTKETPHSEPAERIGIAVFQFIDRPQDHKPMKDRVTPDGN